ncbi:MAG: alpha/beta hydrolase [Moraxellaceae bacterium]|nr:alpha/beta hydrolase [Moraxellaceae bacterium]
MPSTSATATGAIPQPCEFFVGGDRCAALLYRPDGEGPHPVIVMAHGFGGTQQARLPAYALHFRARGMAVLTFDYRHFGNSGGEPRQLLDIGRQLDDWRAAIAFARVLPGIDARRVALWGTSFAGGHVLTLAAENLHLRAVIAQVPFTDGFAHLGGSPLHSLKLTARGLADRAGSLLGQAPRMIGVVGPVGDMAAMTTADAEPGYRRLVDSLPAWRNEVAARIVLDLPLYRPTRTVDRIEAPVLYQIAANDVVTPTRPAYAAAKRPPRAEVITLPGGHFDPYVAPLFDTVVAQQTNFLQRHLL